MADILLSSLLRPRRQIFVSYHHGNDRYYYNEFARIFADSYEAIQDNSVDRIIDSDDADYVIRKIREDYITGTSCTIVLCGSETPWRKFVDWEIKATLDKQHGLIGVNLPTNPLTPNRMYTVPDRLHDNIQGGYALWIQWNQILAGPDFLAQQIEIANKQPTWLINNSRDLRRRNG
jgi:hypothetical protein